MQKIHGGQKKGETEGKKVKEKGANLHKLPPMEKSRIDLLGYKGGKEKKPQWSHGRGLEN